MPSLTDLPRFEAGMRSISASEMNTLIMVAKRLAREGMVGAARPVQHLIIAQEDIAAGEKGQVKFGFWDDDAEDFEARGDAFDAVNLGGGDIETDGRAVLSMGERQIPFFQYGGGAGGPPRWQDSP